MKKLFPFLSLILLASCGKNMTSERAGSENALEDFSYTTDTLIMDVGDEIFNPGAYYGSGLSADGKRGYWFYEPEKQIHEYELTQLKLSGIHPFETDGPDAIPDYLNHFQVLPNREFFMASSVQTGVFSIRGKRLLNLKLQLENVKGFDADAAFSLTNEIHITPDKKKIISLPNTFIGPVAGLAVINIESMTGTLKGLPALEMTDNFNITFQQGNGITRSGDFQRLTLLNDHFIVYSGATSDIYTYDWKSDSLRLYSFPHRLVAKSKTGDFPTEVDSHERRMEVGKEMRKQITFGEFYWDETRNNYFRFASKTIEEKTTVFLFVYDEQFTLLGETTLEGIKNLFFRAFIRDGRLYNYSVSNENPILIAHTLNF